jgi:DNA polymerase-4
VIVYVHVPGFYAAIEQADNPSLRGLPVIVGGDPKKRGIVTSASAEAARARVEPGTSVRDALDRCPDAIVRPTRLQRYREVSQAMISILWSASDRLEEDGLDGAYLEPPPGSDPVKLAAELCVRLQAELGVRAVAGVGVTRFVAHAAARRAGSGGIRAVEPERTLDFLNELPVTELWGLGPATARKLAEHGIERIGDLQQRSADALVEIVGRGASAFLQLARAEDRGGLRPRARPRTISQERTLAQPTVDLRTLGDLLRELAGRFEAQLVRERRAARTVRLALRFVDEHELTRSVTLATPVASQAELRDAALELLRRAQPGARSVRRVRLQLSNLERRRTGEDAQQLRLF